MGAVSESLPVDRGETTSIPTDTLDVVLDILDEYAIHLAIAQTDAEYARENDYSVIIANDIARIDEVRRVLRAAR
jgi:hypothetical protein